MDRLAVCTLIIIALLGLTEASHFRYGTITWQKAQTNARQVTFSLSFAERRSYYGAPNIGDTVYDIDLCYGDGNCDSIPLYVNNIDAANDIVYLSYTGPHTYGGANNYIASVSSCCRIFALNNDASYSYQVTTGVLITQAEINGQVPPNNSPTSNILPIINVQQNVVPFTYQISSSDIDGDSRTFRMATANEQGESDATQPPGLTVSPSGLVTLTQALAQGYWTTQQVITDSFGNYVVVDYMINVQPPQSYCNSSNGQCNTPCQSSADCAACGGSQSSCINAEPRFVVNDINSGLTPRTNRPTPARSSVYNLQPGQSLTLYFTADDANLYRTQNPVQIQLGAIPARMTQTPQVNCDSAHGCVYVGPYSQPQTLSVTYNPIAADAGSHVLCASAQSMANYLPYSQHCITIVVSNITDVCGDGVVGVTEACDSTPCCSADCKSFLAAGTVCGASSGACGSAATCTGGSGTCPAGSFSAAGTVCRSSAGPCDQAETCSGSSNACPPDTFSSGNQCRASAGPCDQAETCDGTSVNCPADTFQSGTTCRASAGPCDQAETCSGSSASCPADTFQSGSTCRPSAGPCDQAETCDGTSVNCPADSFQSGTTCRASAGPCDIAETCAGSSASCPADTFQSGTTCRPSAGVCDVAETCSGSAASCPADGFEPTSYVCRPPANGCDVPEYCTGASISCPADLKNTSAACSTPTDYCNRNKNVGTSGKTNYFCAGPNAYMQCVSGTSNYAAKMPCAAGTHCTCADGVDCSQGGTVAPCH